MKNALKISSAAVMIFIMASCNGQEKSKENLEQSGPEPAPKEQHRYGGWYCPDNFGFLPVNIKNLDAVPAVSNRLPNKEELDQHMSLINVDTEKFPNARALKMDLPRLARVHTAHTGMDELVIVIQAIVVDEDSVVGYRFANGGNGSAWLSDVKFLSEEEVSNLGDMPFVYSKSTMHSNTSDIWRAFVETEYARGLAKKFNQQAFFYSTFNPEATARLEYEDDKERAQGYVGILFGNLYLHIDYDRDGFHYSEKILISENQAEGIVDMHLATGPFPKDFDKHQKAWTNFVEEIGAKVEP